MTIEPIELSPPAKTTRAECNYCGIKGQCIVCACCGEYAHKSCAPLSENKPPVRICNGCREDL